MRKNFSELSPAEQKAIELEYHQMEPEDFDEMMREAEWHVPQADRLEEVSEELSR